MVNMTDELDKEEIRSDHLKQLDRRDSNKQYYNRKQIQQQVLTRTRRKMKKFLRCGLCMKKVDKTEFHHFSHFPNIAIEVCLRCHKNLHYVIKDKKFEWDIITVEKTEAL